ncbi:ABC transporter permease, partial [Ancylomarina sp. DW003]
VIENLVGARELGLRTNGAYTSEITKYSIGGMLKYIFLYIPLVTMGLMSKEFSSGSIKLLYSSPISNLQIVLGKFLSMMIFGLALCGIMFLLLGYGLIGIKMYHFPLILTGLLGMFLLICTYSAIGLFLSSLSSYQIVAAIGTFVTLFVLGKIGTVWQDIEFVRDITYWLDMGGRASFFVRGLICSEDILYFILISGLFISFTVLRLKGIREKRPKYISVMRYAFTFCIVALVGYVSTIPVLMKYHDSTITKTRSLTENSQKVLSEIKGKIKITTYVNLFSRRGDGLPRRINIDLDRYERYRRFRPDIKMEYKYYYGKDDLELFKKRWGGKTDQEALEKKAKVFKV